MHSIIIICHSSLTFSLLIIKQNVFLHVYLFASLILKLKVMGFFRGPALVVRLHVSYGRGSRVEMDHDLSLLLPDSAQVRLSYIYLNPLKREKNNFQAKICLRNHQTLSYANSITSLPVLIREIVYLEIIKRIMLYHWGVVFLLTFMLGISHIIGAFSRIYFGCKVNLLMCFITLIYFEF